MAAPTIYDAPASQMVALLHEARRYGRSFETAWAQAMREGEQPVITRATPPDQVPPGCVIWARDTYTRKIEQEALRAAKRSFWRAYWRLPMSRRERALANTVGLLATVETDNARSTEGEVMAVVRSGQRPSTADLARRLDVSERMVRHALSKLRARGDLRRCDDGRYEIGEGSQEVRPGPPGTLAAEIPRLLSDGPRSKNELVVATGRSPNGVHDALGALLRAGRVRRTGYGVYELVSGDVARARTVDDVTDPREAVPA